ncbi:MAG: hypothetical protein BWX99_02716 [Deltaproteobacteria bacterium ADurb.Bin151]|jgi:hypothetical protein|nr:DUF4150 domain-containing protein [Smithella sp.]OQB51652.1 MAG: hypothetical protein BWX99_02716 [Deltaproteobacteria bacterium ADurb.Bin151]HOG83070.1 DUF4150 domain-containing protein [Smithellaceae bacterium]HOQ42992.1 DUF4150 domain-containing protein [Smithellaceae bacterium]HPL67635.1 DUF4150 domain-containing protein [Smithellaceae bacterium]
MGATVTANHQTVVHRDSGGTVVTSPDVCQTQTGIAVVPIPYVNTTRSADTTQGSATVTMDSNPVMLSSSVFSTSSGDEPGTIGGISSGVNKGKARFITTSSDVIVEGKPVGRRTDLMVSNLSSSGNTPPAALQQPNADVSHTDNDGYVLAVALEYEYPYIVSNRVDQPRLSLSYTLAGPDTIQYNEEQIYQGVHRKMTQGGTHSFNVDDFKMENRHIIQGAKNKQPV